MRPRSILTGAALAAAITAFGSAEAFAGDRRGFKTAQPSMLTPVKPGVKISPLLTVGDVLRSGYRFESIPDGISVNTRHHSRVDLFVNHETGKVPFPYNPANPTAANGENDFDNSQVSRLTLDRQSARVLAGLVRHHERPRLPALLLQLPRDLEGGIRPQDPVHERGVARLGVPPGSLLAAGDG